ncbi:ABC transporter permease, partial [uncultured Flavonifractor sp.]|uniref:ABC transporter permease n=1 Tax=uncultured Flavonifractor sp. TaxID=1193534 RepID=UPI002634120C
MRKKDLLRICLQNLMRRRSRTFLTVLGVLIGCCSIVIMVSLGIGMKETQEKLLSEMGDLTIITVSAPQKGKGKVKLDDALVKRLRNMDGVVGVSPKQTLEVESIRLLAGTGNRYAADWTSVVGMDTGEMERLGYRILNGSAPKRDGEVVVGEFLAYSFKDTLRPEGRNMIDRWAGELDDNGQPTQLPPPYFDPMKTTLTMEIATSSGTIKLPVTPSGVVKEDYSKGYETSEGMIMSLTDLRKLLDKVQGPAKKKLPYDSVLVKVSAIDRVADIEQEIKAMGYGTESMESIRKPMEKEARQKQMMLGGL